MTRFLTINEGLTVAIKGIDVNNISLDSWGVVSSSSPFSDINLDFTSSSIDRFVTYDQVSGNGGNIVFDSNSDTAILSVADQSSLVRLKTLVSGLCFSNTLLLVRQSFIFPAPENGLICRVGYTDALNGFFLEQNNTTISLVVTSDVNGVSTEIERVAQNVWNIDTLTTAPEDGSSFILDLFQIQSFFIEIQWPTGYINFGFEHNGTIFYVHRFSLNNILMRKPSFYLNWEIERTTSGGTNAELKAIAGSSVIKGVFNKKIVNHSINFPVDNIDKVEEDNTLVVLLLFRLKSEASKARVSVEEVTIKLHTDCSYRIDISKNIEYNGVYTLVWESLPQSPLEYAWIDPNSLTVSNSNIIKSFSGKGYKDNGLKETYSLKTREYLGTDAKYVPELWGLNFISDSKKSVIDTLSVNLVEEV